MMGDTYTALTAEEGNILIINIPLIATILFNIIKGHFYFIVSTSKAIVVHIKLQIEIEKIKQTIARLKIVL